MSPHPWSMLEPQTALREHAARVSAHASFYDSSTYARCGVATALRVTAAAATTNLLDKTAGETQEYLEDAEHCRAIELGWFAERYPELEPALRDARPGYWIWNDDENRHEHR